jgi:hypothetical protein
MIPISNMQHGVIAGGLDPIDFFLGNEGRAPTGANTKAARRNRLVRARGRVATAQERQVFPHARERMMKTRSGDGLEQIIHRASVESLHGVTVETSDKNNQRQRTRINPFQDFEAVHSWNLNIEQEKIWLAFFKDLENAGTVVAFGHDFDVFLGREKSPQPLAGDTLIIDDDGTEVHEGEEQEARFREGRAPALVKIT